MAMRYDGKEVQEEFEKAFGKPITEATEQEIWFLVKCIKHCRVRCRNNSALNNWLGRNFVGHSFSTETKINARREEYDGLKITKK